MSGSALQCGSDFREWIWVAPQLSSATGRRDGWMRPTVSQAPPTLRDAAEQLELGYEPVALRCFEPGRTFLSALRSLGGTATPWGPFHWIIDPQSSNDPIPGAHLVPELIDGSVAILDFQGVMLVGRPGTGKTMLIRHLMTRFSDLRRFIFVNDPTMKSSENLEFRNLARELGASDDAALVVIEDIDRLFDSGTVSPELFLNVLDGLLEPSAPTLWIATSNDPSGMEDNLLDRPGRFDRVFVIPLPGLEERARLVQRYSGAPISDLSVRSLASRTEGLSAAHVREICVAAALAAAESGGRYSEHLEKELVRVRGQHEQSRRYGAAVRREAGVGFGKVYTARGLSR